jgi:hypothetical protein
MIESTPSRPYNQYVTDLLRVERNMLLRRRRLISVLAPNEIAPTVREFSPNFCTLILLLPDYMFSFDGSRRLHSQSPDF